MLQHHKHILRTTTLIFLSFSTFAKFENTTVSGTVLNSGAKTVFITYYDHYSTFKLISINAPIDSRGNFKLQFAFETPRIVWFWVEEKQQTIFIEPKDHLILRADYPKFYETILFEGKGGDNNNFLHANYSFLYYMFNEPEKVINEALEKSKGQSGEYFKSYLDNFYKEKQAFIEDHHYNISDELYKTCQCLLYTRTNMAKMNWLLHAKDFYGEKIPSEVIRAYYAGWFDNLNINDVSLIKVNTYTHFLTRFVEISTYLNSLLEKKEMKDSLNKNYQFYKNTKLLLKGEISDYVQTYYARLCIVHNFSPLKTVIYKDFMKTVQVAQLKKFIQELYYENPLIIKTVLALGSKIPDFTLPDIDNKEIEIANFEGEVVFLNFWSLHCDDYVEQIPYAKVLEEKYKGKKVKFVNVAVDNTRQSWENFIKGRDIRGINVHSNNADLLKKFGVSHFPTYYIIRKDRKILSIGLPPSSKESEKIIDFELSR